LCVDSSIFVKRRAELRWGMGWGVKLSSACTLANFSADAKYKLKL